ncbi:Retrovirus-related Pol polyprotein from transposon 412 [Araneus ventricosus]|uniref:RNA-directed DNA polymerase n=1 Tax=Araneus ventricosus TaxID=182803 RepID=A0A4Y2G729_ARAVE|nr:Retrovirus-related Pol polyprotein from transposon 412 [Araneus ventricosus]
MKTLSKSRERFYWDLLRDDVEKWCRECHACGARNGPKTRTRGRLQRYNVGSPFERMALDILEPFPVTTKGNRYVLVLMDYFTIRPEAIPVPDQEASTVAEELVRTWISLYGVPMILHLDQGTNFNSALFTELYKLLGILKTRTTALHPESDGMVERLNRTILNHLSSFRRIKMTGIHICRSFSWPIEARTMKRPDSLHHRYFSVEFYDCPVISSLDDRVIRLPRRMNT